MNYSHIAVEAISAVFVLCIRFVLFIDDTIKRLTEPNKDTCKFTDHLVLMDRRIREQSSLAAKIETQTFESLYVKHIELKLKMIERDRNMVQRMLRMEERMKALINASEKNTYVALEPFLNEKCHTTFYIHEPIDYIEINLPEHVKLIFFDEYDGGKGKHCFFEFFLYDFNDNLIDEFDIDFDYINNLKGYDCGYGSDRVARMTEEITNYIKEKLNLLIKDEKKYIYSNTKGNATFFASPCVKITLPLKICFKKIIISVKDTVCGRTPDTRRSDGYMMDAKPTNFSVTLSSWNEEKTQKKIVKKFYVDTKDSDYTCIVHNYVPLETTGNTILS